MSKHAVLGIIVKKSPHLEWMQDKDYADTLYITLPKDLGKRLDIVPIVFDRRPDEFDYDWNSDEPIRLWWD